MITRRTLARRSMAAGMIAVPALAPNARAQGRTIRIATEGAYAPWNFTAAGGALQGFEIDLANDLCRRMNATCTIVAQDWDGIIPGLNAGRYDAIMAGMNITDRRLEAINFSRPYAGGPHAFAIMPNSPLAGLPMGGTRINAGTQEAEVRAAVAAMTPLLRGKTVGTQTGTTNIAFLNAFFPNIFTLREYRTTEEHDLDLANGRLDAIFVAQSAVVATAEKPEFRGLTTAGPLFAGGPLGRGVAVGIRKADNDLVTAFNTAIAAALADGTISRLSTQWFKTDLTPQQ